MLSTRLNPPLLLGPQGKWIIHLASDCNFIKKRAVIGGITGIASYRKTF